MPSTGNNNTSSPLGDRGFTILEVVIALAIFSVGIMAVASLQVSSTNGDLRARLATEAATVAHDQAERLLSMNYDPADPTEEFINSGSFAGFPTPRETTIGRYTVDWIVEAHSLIPGALKVTVQTRWAHYGSNKLYELEFVKIAQI